MKKKGTDKMQTEKNKELKKSFDFEAFQNQAIADMKAGKSLVGKGGIFTPLIKQFLEMSLEGEMGSHMNSCSQNPENQNRRNGKSRKEVKSPMGTFELETPRDRDGTFEPQIVKKRQTVLNESLDKKILGLDRCGHELPRYHRPC